LRCGCDCVVTGRGAFRGAPGTRTAGAVTARSCSVRPYTSSNRRSHTHPCTARGGKCARACASAACRCRRRRRRVMCTCHLLPSCARSPGPSCCAHYTTHAWVGNGNAGGGPAGRRRKEGQEREGRGACVHAAWPLRGVPSARPTAIDVLTAAPARLRWRCALPCRRRPRRYCPAGVATLAPPPPSRSGCTNTVCCLLPSPLPPPLVGVPLLLMELPASVSCRRCCWALQCPAPCRQRPAGALPAKPSGFLHALRRRHQTPRTSVAATHECRACAHARNRPVRDLSLLARAHALAPRSRRIPGTRAILLSGCRHGSAAAAGRARSSRRTRAWAARHRGRHGTQIQRTDQPHAGARPAPH